MAVNVSKTNQALDQSAGLTNLNSDSLDSSSGLAVGVEGVLPPRQSTEVSHLAGTGELQTGAVSVPETGIDVLFALNTVDNNYQNGLSFNHAYPELLTQDGLSTCLQEIKQDLEQERDPNCRVFLRDVLNPLLEDQELLATFVRNNMRV